MRSFLKLSVLAILAAWSGVASAAELEFHGYSRVGFGFTSEGGNQVAFGLNSSGGHKTRLGNEADFCLEPSFVLKFTKLDDKSEWGVRMLPAVYRRMNSGSSSATASVPSGAVDANLDPYHNQADGGLPVSYKEYYFFGNNVPQLGGGSIWAGMRQFDRFYLGAINDQFLEAQDGVGAGVEDIPAGPARVSFSVTASPFTNGTDAQVDDRDLSIGARVTSLPTFGKDGQLQLWGRVHVPMQREGVAERKTGFSASVIHIAGLGAAGNLTLAARYDKNAHTDQQNTGITGWEQLRGVLVYGVNLPSARTSLDVLAEYAKRKAVESTDAELTAAQRHDIDWIQVGLRTDTQISGPFRFLLEAAYDTSKDKKQDDKAHNLLKITPALAISGGNEAWSRPTFRLFYTYASWNEDARADIAANWKSLGFNQFAGEKSGGVIGVQAEGGW